MGVIPGFLSGVRVAVFAAILLLTTGVPAQQAQTPAVQRAEPRSGTATSPDGRRLVWISEDGSSVWGRTRTSAAAPWSAEARLFTIRGSIRNLVFSPDSRRIAFENPRPSATTDQRGERWQFIAVFAFEPRWIGYVDPSFHIDADPRWSADGASITFTRRIGTLPPRPVTKPAPRPTAWTPPARRPGERFSLASVLAAPFVYEPAASGDRRAIAYAAREGIARNIYFLRLREPARQIAAFTQDDGRELTDLALSRTGAAVAFVRGAATNPTSLPDPPEPEIWIVPSTGGTARQIGTGTSPAFAADDRALTWASGNRRMSAVLRWDGGRFTGLGPVTSQTVERRRGNMPREYPSPDGARVALRSRDAIEIRDGVSKTTWTVPDSAGSDTNLVWSPDSRYLAFRRAGADVEGSAGIQGYRYNGAPIATRPWALLVADTQTSQVRQLFEAAPGMGSVASGPMFWSHDHRVAFQWEGDGWQHYYAVSAASSSAGAPPAPTLITRGDGDVESAQVSLDHRHLIVTSNIGDLGRRHVTIHDFNGGTIAIVRQGAASQWSPVPLADGALAYIEADHARPPAVMIRDRDGRTRAAGLPQPAREYPADALVEPMLVEFAATDGQTAYGQLFVPAQPNGCGIVFVHGGIRRQMLPGYHYMDAYTHLYELNQYLVSHGCVVLSVEYRSSIMRGYRFRHAPGWGMAGASEMLDVVGGARYLMARDDVDETRGIGIYGLSWGGYITAQALARHSDIFSVGFDMAGVHTSPNPEGVEHSAMAFLDRWTSPIYLAQGDDDRNVVFAEGIRLARALHEQRPDVELVERVFPNETHDMYLTFENLVTLYQEGADFLLSRLRK